MSPAERDPYMNGQRSTREFSSGDILPQIREHFGINGQRESKSIALPNSRSITDSFDLQNISFDIGVNNLIQHKRQTSFKTK
jgi:hypothetical protein